MSAFYFEASREVYKKNGMNNPVGKSIAFFDFDGTITRKDTFIDFHHYTLGIKKFLLCLLNKSPTLISYKLGFVENGFAKECLFGEFWKGISYDFFLQKALSYSLNRIDIIVRPKALEKIAWHQEQGDEVVIVTASLEDWVIPWCRRKGISKVIGTKAAQKDGLLTGVFATKNCYGLEKVRRILEEYDIKSVSRIYAYGDSRGDKELIKIAHVKYYRGQQIS